MTDTETNGTPHWRERARERGRREGNKERERRGGREGGGGERGREGGSEGGGREEKEMQRKVKKKENDSHLVLSVISC